MNNFEQYTQRKIEFLEVCQIEGWTVKVYTITNREAYESHQATQNALQALRQWLPDTQRADLPTYKVAFIILHEGREGVWILLSWWTGGEMLETVTHFSPHGSGALTQSPFHGHALVCVWELQVWIHERAAWIKHILSKATNPDFDGYLSDTLKEIS